MYKVGQYHNFKCPISTILRVTINLLADQATAAAGVAPLPRPPRPPLTLAAAVAVAIAVAAVVGAGCSWRPPPPPAVASSPQKTRRGTRARGARSPPQPAMGREKYTRTMELFHFHSRSHNLRIH